MPEFCKTHLITLTTQKIVKNLFKWSAPDDMISANRLKLKYKKSMDGINHAMKQTYKQKFRENSLKLNFTMRIGFTR